MEKEGYPDVLLSPSLPSGLRNVPKPLPKPYDDGCVVVNWVNVLLFPSLFNRRLSIQIYIWEHKPCTQTSVSFQFTNRSLADSSVKKRGSLDVHLYELNLFIL